MGISGLAQDDPPEQCLGEDEQGDERPVVLELVHQTISSRRYSNMARLMPMSRLVSALRIGMSGVPTARMCHTCTACCWPRRFIRVTHCAMSDGSSVSSRNTIWLPAWRLAPSFRAPMVAKSTPLGLSVHCWMMPSRRLDETSPVMM